VSDARALVRRYYDEVLTGRRPEVLDELLAPGFVSHGGGGASADRAAYAAAVAATHAAFPDLQVRIEDQLADGDRVATRWTAEGTHRGAYGGLPPTGRRVAVSAIHIHRVEGDRLAELWEEIDLLGLLRQLGALGGAP
jgi:steroid delta-isomerase-like uncharacterized protein